MSAQGSESIASVGFCGIAPADTAAVHNQSSAPVPSEPPIPDAEDGLTLVRPPPVVPAPDRIRLPAPKYPTILLLISANLRREPLSIPVDVAVRRCEVGIVPFELVRDAEAELADDGGPVAAAVVAAGLLEVGGGGLAGAGVVDAVVVGPFEVPVVVVGGEDVVGQVLVRVAGTPFCVLRMNSLVHDDVD